MSAEILIQFLNQGSYWPALAVALLLLTHVLRRKGADRLLSRWTGADLDDVRRLRPWIPLVLSAGAFLAAWLSGAVDVAQAAVESVVAAVVAMAGHDTGQAVRALLRALLGPTAGAGPGRRIDDPDITERESKPDKRTRGRAKGLPSAHARKAFERLHVPHPADVELYLRRQGWTIDATYRHGWATYRKDGRVIAVNCDKFDPDYTLHAGLLLDDLVAFERRGPSEILGDIVRCDTRPGSETVRRTMQRRARTATTAGCLLLACASVGLSSTGCVTPQTRPLSSYAAPSMASPGATETVKECRRMRERSLWAAAGAAVASSVAGGLAGVRETVDRRGWVIGLSVGGILAAGAGAGLALASTSYQGALDAHCTPWPSQAQGIGDDHGRARDRYQRHDGEQGAGGARAGGRGRRAGPGPAHGRAPAPSAPHLTITTQGERRGDLPGSR